jgi:regulator of sirC expression with transglutaminase-like and TPR domain
MNASHRSDWPILAMVLIGWTCSVRAMAAGEPDPAESAIFQEAVTDPTAVEDLVRKTRDSVVMITVEGRDRLDAGIGTGFVVDADGLIATNLHVIGEARPITVRFRDGRELPVTEIHASDHQLDLAILRVSDRRLTPLPLAFREKISQGQSIVVVGNPMGLRDSVVSGVVSGQRQIDGRRMLQIAMPIEPGNSGGPVLDLRGRVVGIVTLKSMITPNLGFAVEISELQSLLLHPNPIPMSRWETIGSLDPSRWAPRLGARWEQRAGRIVVSEAGAGFGGRAICLWQPELPATDFEVGVYVKLSDESGAAGLIFAADEADHHYGFYPTAGRLRLTKFDGPTVFSWTILDEITSEHYRPGQWNHLKVRIETDKISCFVNDQLVVQRAESGLRNGQVGLAKFRQTEAEFRDFQVAPRIPDTQLSPDHREQIRQQLANLSIDEWVPSAAVDRLSQDASASVAVLEQEARQLRQQAAQRERLAQDVHLRSVCRQLESVFAQPESNVDLVCAALLVSNLDNRELNVDAYVGQVDRMVQEIRAALPPEASSEEKLEALNRYLFTQNGFHGSRTDYYNVANSYFDRLLDDREGLPITLCVLYMELGRRLGLHIDGIGLPGHFVVRYVPTEGEAKLLDVFNAGVQMSRTDAELLAIQVTGLPFQEEYMQATSKRDIAVRMLRNLLGVAQREDDKEAMLRYLEALVTLLPDDASLHGMRAIVRSETGRRQAAIDDLDWFLEKQPETAELEQIRRLKSRFEQRRAVPEVPADPR